MRSTASNSKVSSGQYLHTHSLVTYSTCTCTCILQCTNMYLLCFAACLWWVSCSQSVFCIVRIVCFRPYPTAYSRYTLLAIGVRGQRSFHNRLHQGSLGPRPSRDSRTKEGLVSNVSFLGCAESACDRELCNST